MTRILLAGTALIALFASVGCCYHPGCVNPYTGTPYGGHWESSYGGPSGALGWGGARGGWGGYRYGNRYRHGYGYAGCGDPCCDTGRGDGCIGEPMMMPQTFQNGVQPGGGMKPPVPDPNMSMQQGMGGSTTYVTPRPMPTSSRPIRQAKSMPEVSAF